MEQARAYDRLSHHFKMTQEQMAQRTGKDRASVSNFLRLLRLPPKYSKRWKPAVLALDTHARCLVSNRRNPS